MSAQCDMRQDCAAPVAMIGSKGYVYCREHGIQRRGVENTRLMRPWELKLVQAGKPIPSYEPLPKAVALAGGVNAYLNRNLPGTHVDPAPAAVTGGGEPDDTDDDDGTDWCPACERVTEYDGEVCRVCGRVWGYDAPPAVTHVSGRTPEQIAADILDPLGIDDNGQLAQLNTSLVRRWLERAAREAQQTGRLVVSTRDRKVRVGLTENTVTDLTGIIAGYIADGYTHDELVIEGVTE